jgi:hypothetical protein
MDPIRILRRAWYILWSYRALWIFGLILALATASSTGGGGNNGIQYQVDGEDQRPAPQTFQEFLSEMNRGLERLFREGIPELDITGEALTIFLWVVAIFVVLMLILGIGVAIARYISETAVIRMVDEYENTGDKLSIRQGFRIGWSRTSWRLFLINLIVNLPIILLVLTLIGAGVLMFLAALNGNGNFNALSVVTLIGLTFLAISMVVILSIILSLLRQFFWRVCVLEAASVGESLRRGFAMVRENWKNVGLMWLVMIGLGIAWIVISIIAFIISLPVVILTSILGAVIVAAPALLLVGLFSLFISGPLAWIAGALFVLPLFFLIAFSPWVLLSSWQRVYTSTVWTLTYREIKTLPALTPGATVEPLGD